MNFNSLRKEITNNNVSVKELINDIFVKIQDVFINHINVLKQQHSI